MSERIEREQQDAGKREENAERIMRFLSLTSKIEPLHGKKVEEIFSGDDSKREFIDKLQPEEFIELLSGINGILRDKNKEQWKMDGENVEISSMIETIIPPDFKDKPELFMEALSAAKEMNKQGRSLEDIAILLASSINAVHGFNDGNGRTSRLVYSLLTKNFEGRDKEEIQKVLLGEGRMEINIDPGHIDYKIERMMKELADVNFQDEGGEKIRNVFWVNVNERREGIDQEKIDKLQHMIDGKTFMSVPAFYEYFSNHPEIEYGKYIRNVPGAHVLIMDELMKDLDNEKIQEIIDNLYEMKKERVEKIIDCVANPDKKEYKIDENGQKMQLFDYYKNEIKKEQERNQQILKEENKRETDKEKFDFGT